MYCDMFPYYYSNSISCSELWRSLVVEENIYWRKRSSLMDYRPLGTTYSLASAWHAVTLVDWWGYRKTPVGFGPVRELHVCLEKSAENMDLSIDMSLGPNIVSQLVVELLLCNEILLVSNVRSEFSCYVSETWIESLSQSLAQIHRWHRNFNGRNFKMMSDWKKKIKKNCSGIYFPICLTVLM